MKWNLDSLKLPDVVVDLCPNKARLFAQMRAFEQDLSCYMKAKLLNVKEDLLSSSTKVKRLLRLTVTVESQPAQWKIRI
jgi:hypothetical protein